MPPESDSQGRRLTPSQQEYLAHWGSVAHNHTTILEFLEWAERGGHLVFELICLPKPKGSGTRAASFSEVVDAHLQVNRKELDRARRALLEEQVNSLRQQGSVHDGRE